VEAYEQLHVDAPPFAVVGALRHALAERAMTEYAVVDHGHDMAQAGAPGFEAWTLIFGNPAGGAKLLALRLDAAVDIPLRLAVVADANGGSDIVLRNMRSLLDEAAQELADGFTEILRSLAARARDLAIEA
jgi:uncharacterized protein (DUF302 family)